MRECKDCGSTLHTDKKIIYCTACATARKRIWREKNADHEKSLARQWRENNATYRDRSRDQRNTTSIKWNAENRSIVNQRGRDRRLSDLPAYMWKAARTRAKAKNIPFDITVEDIGQVPSTCPILNIPLKAGAKSNNSPSLDRIIPSLGYVKGNIWIISSLANSIKGSKSLEDLRQNHEVLSKRLRNIEAVIFMMENFQ